MGDLNEHEPPPVPNERQGCWEFFLRTHPLLKEQAPDFVSVIRERDRIGRQKYKTPLQPFNGRDPLVDTFQELLDALVYLTQAIMEVEVDLERLSPIEAVIPCPKVMSEEVLRQRVQRASLREIQRDTLRSALSIHKILQRRQR